MDLISGNDKQIVRKRIVSNITDFIKDLNLDNIHEEFYAFCYLLWNGYLSVDKSFSYGRGIIENNELYAVFLGESTSTGASSLLTEVFKDKSLFTRTIGISIQKIKLDTLMNIKRNYNEELKDFSKYKRFTNERVTYATNISQNGATLIFDPILLSECEVLENGRTRCINGKYKINKKQLEYTLKGPFFYAYDLPKVPIITKEEVFDSYIKMNDLCDNNKNKFEDFYKENSKYYEKIKKLI